MNSNGFLRPDMPFSSWQTDRGLAEQISGFLPGATLLAPQAHGF